jgi:hypothetical protein
MIVVELRIETARCHLCGRRLSRYAHRPWGWEVGVPVAPDGPVIMRPVCSEACADAQININTARDRPGAPP